ncbi:DUF3696 domain-containing protein [Aliivibrio sifiae]|uniref:DUF3696 domain-containing protein n=1 Tax=Aliivibrio sifiae TaxID=566293 RepID=UPI003D109004
MINELIIYNFKSVKEEKLTLSKINILSGINGSGKSTVCQALLLLKDTFDNYQSGNNSTCSLNNKYMHLGTLKDSLHSGADNDSIVLAIETKTCINVMAIDASNDKSQNDFSQVSFGHMYEGDAEDQIEIETLSNLELASVLNNLKYLKAEREGPRVTQSKNDKLVRQQNSIGLSGEYVNSYLEHYLANGSKDLGLDNRFHVKGEFDTLPHQIELWLKDICPNINFNTTELLGTDLVSIQYNFNTSAGASQRFRATNVGFGISYVLPVIVMCLSAKPGDILIIDTPEAHLHPKGQFLIGELLAKTAADDIQIIVETHSDHVLNGIRVQTIKEYLNPEDSQFYYFELCTGSSYVSPVTKVHNPKINKEGQFNHWPKGFFDEWSYALDEMLRLRGEKSSNDD